MFTALRQNAATFSGRLGRILYDLEAPAGAATPHEAAIKRPSWRTFAAAIAATIVVTVGVQNLISAVGSPDEATLAVVAGHMRGQISGQPVDVASSDRHTVKPWLAGKLPVAAMVVDLAPEGFELLGGRIDIVGGNPAPTLVYKRRQHLVSVTELRANIADYPATPRRRTVDGYPVLSGRMTHVPTRRSPISPRRNSTHSSPPSARPPRKSADRQAKPRAG